MPLAGIFGQLSAYLAGVPSASSRTARRSTPTAVSCDGWMRLMAYGGVYTDVVAVSRMITHHASTIRNGSSTAPSSFTTGFSIGAHPLRRNRKHEPLSGSPKSDFILAAVGRIEEQKNFAFLLPVIARLNGATLVIAGTGSLRPKLKQRSPTSESAPRVRLLGVVPREQIPDLLRAADLFVQPSLSTRGKAMRFSKRSIPTCRC